MAAKHRSPGKCIDTRAFVVAAARGGECTEKNILWNGIVNKIVNEKVRERGEETSKAKIDTERKKERKKENEHEGFIKLLQCQARAALGRVGRAHGDVEVGARLVLAARDGL